jgi:hypothetical protein
MDQASTSNSQASNIAYIFARQRASKRPKTPEKEKFNIDKFKRLLLNYLISNNLSFKSISSKTFKSLLLYLNE